MIRKIFLFSFTLFAAGMTSDRNLSPEPVQVPSVYERYLDFPVPSHGITVEFNPPVLRWPIQKGKVVTYDVRLSADSSFATTFASVSATPWAMFNPHRRLPPGKWYWQCRPSGKKWSATNSFVVDADAINIVSPSVDLFLKGIPADHPRLLADRKTLPAIRALKGSADAKAILNEAEAALGGPLPKEADAVPRRSETDPERDRKLKQDASNALGSRAYNAVNALSQAWVLSGDDRYQQRAIAIALEVATWDPKGLTASKTSDFSDARCTLTMALAFDTFFDDLGTNERSSLRDAISSRLRSFYDLWSNNQEARLLSGHVWQHILHYFFESTLAIYGHVPEASTWSSYAYELFLARAPILGGKDGGWTEGASYFKMNMETLISVPLRIKAYTGFDFINAHPWYRNNTRWLVLNVPPGSSSDGFGDNTEDIVSPGAEYISFARVIAKLTGDPLASWYALKCEQFEQPDRSKNRMLRWVRLCETGNMPLPKALKDSEVDAANVFRDIGLVSMHTAPATPRTNLMLAMRSSPFGCYGHFLSDQNAFNILYGGKRVFFHSGYKVTMSDPHRTGWYQHTKSTNSVLVNGQGQPYSTEAFGWIRRFAAADGIAYALADASNAYRSVETGEDYGVKKFYRHVLLLEGDLVVVYDELENTTDAEWSWLIHGMSEITVDQNSRTFQSDLQGVRGAGKIWSSVPVTLSVADTFEIPALNWRGAKDASGELRQYTSEQWHLKAVTRSKTSTQRFLAVMQISPQANISRVRAQEEGGALHLTVGDWQITSVLDRNKPAALRVSRGGGNVSFTYSDAGNSELVARSNGKRIVQKVEDVMPTALDQSILYHAGKKSGNAAHRDQK